MMRGRAALVTALLLASFPSTGQAQVRTAAIFDFEITDTSRDKAVAAAERIRETFAQMAQDVDGRPVCATVSIGLVHCHESTLDVPELLAQADHALYYAKERGRNRVEVASLDMTGDRRKFEATSTSSVAAIGTKSAA